MAVLAKKGAAQGEAKVAQAGWSDHLLTVLMGTWMMIGLFVDGWAHNNLGESLETFFTPWHGIFYSGFAATAGWMLWLVLRNRRAGLAGQAAIPQGYGLGLVGLVLFGLGGFGDMLWHTFLGIEVSVEALLSPTHLLMFWGGVLIMSSPARAHWAVTRADGEAFGWRPFFPALLSVTMTVAFATFLNQYLWAYFRAWPFVADASRSVAYWQDRFGLACIILTTLFLVAPLLFMLKRWQLPVGAVTFMFGVISVEMAGMHLFENPLLTIGAPVLTGVVGDVLLAVLRPSAQRTWAFRAFGIAVAVALAGFYLAAGRIVYGQFYWSPELWAGAITVAAIAGFGLSVLLVPENRHSLKA